MNRRVWSCRWLILCCLGLAADAHAAFGFEDVAALAAARAALAYQPRVPASPALAALTYDEYRRIQFREPYSLWRDAGLPFQVQFFHAGGGFRHSLKLNEVVDGAVQPLSIPRAAFDADGLPLPEEAAVAGFRVLHPLHAPDRWDEVWAVLGASYFRALGTEQRYGASVRALAVDTVGGSGEEFPDHVEFWLDRPAAGAGTVVVHALVDGPRVTGAYRYLVKPGSTTTIDVQARLYLRSAVATLGIAPISSMYLAGENQPAAGDFRPEVHDSDGLQIASAEGEWLWRPLINPDRPFVTSFNMATPRGFGLMQRDRAFDSYQDLEARYERRPSVWVEPLGDWGRGRVELLQFRTPDETHDNVATYWVPEILPPAGQPLNLSWRLHWAAELAPRPPGSMTVQTRRGHGWRRTAPRPSEVQLQVDFDDLPGGSFAGTPAGSTTSSTGNDPTTVEAVASGNDNVRGLRARAQRHSVRGGWRMTIDFERVDAARPVELRAFLRRGEQTLTETWTYAMAPES